MPKRAKGLTAAFCNSVKDKGSYVDGAGLMLVVAPTGSKRWIQRLTVRGKRRDLGLGAYPGVSLATARQVAAEYRQIAKSGRDPLAEKQRSADIPTFESVAMQTIAKKSAELSNAKHIQQWENTLKDYAFPRLGKLRVDEIGVEDVLAAIKPIWEVKTETASRVRGRIEAVLAFATVMKWRSGPNPATWGGNLDMLLPMQSRIAPLVHHPALQLHDVHDWWKALSEREGMAAQALRFLTLTWARSGEVRGATWDEIDEDRAVWRIPPQRMKARKEHLVPLTGEAMEILRSITPMNGSPFVFYAPRGGQLSDMALTALMRRMQDAADREYRRATGDVNGVSGRFLDRNSGRPAVVHGIRSTARSWAAEQALDREAAELSLAHRIGNEVEQSYQRAHILERRRHLLAEWAQFLSGKSLFAEVIPFRPRAAQ